MPEIDPAAAVIVAGDDGVALRVREELDGTGVPVVCVCASRASVAATAALATGARVIVGTPAARRRGSRRASGRRGRSACSGPTR